MDIKLKAAGIVNKGTLVVFASDSKKKNGPVVLSSTAKGIDDKMNGGLGKAIDIARFKGKKVCSAQTQT